MDSEETSEGKIHSMSPEDLERVCGSLMEGAANINPDWRELFKTGIILRSDVISVEENIPSSDGKEGYLVKYSIEDKDSISDEALDKAVLTGISITKNAPGESPESGSVGVLGYDSIKAGGLPDNSLEAYKKVRDLLIEVRKARKASKATPTPTPPNPSGGFGKVKITLPPSGTAAPHPPKH